MGHTPEQIVNEMREGIDEMVANNLPAILLIDRPNTVQFIAHHVGQEKLYSLALHHVEYLLRHLTPAGRLHVAGIVASMAAEQNDADEAEQPYAVVQ